MKRASCFFFVFAILAACTGRISLGIAPSDISPDGGDGAAFQCHWDGGCAPITGSVLDPTRNCVQKNVLLACDDPCVTQCNCGGVPEGSCYRNIADGRVVWVEPRYLFDHEPGWTGCTAAEQALMGTYALAVPACSDEADAAPNDASTVPTDDGGPCLTKSESARFCPTTWPDTATDANTFCQTHTAQHDLSLYTLERTTAACGGYLIYQQHNFDAGPVECFYDPQTGNFAGVWQSDPKANDSNHTCGFSSVSVTGCAYQTCADAPDAF
jgi:hypothetical protein